MPRARALLVREFDEGRAGRNPRDPLCEVLPSAGLPSFEDEGQPRGGRFGPELNFDPPDSSPQSGPRSESEGLLRKVWIAESESLRKLGSERRAEAVSDCRTLCETIHQPSGPAAQQPHQWRIRNLDRLGAGKLRVLGQGAAPPLGHRRKVLSNVIYGVWIGRQDMLTLLSQEFGLLLNVRGT